MFALCTFISGCNKINTENAIARLGTRKSTKLDLNNQSSVDFNCASCKTNDTLTGCAVSLTWSQQECVGQLCPLVVSWWRCRLEPPSPLCCRAAGVQSAAAE